MNWIILSWQIPVFLLIIWLFTAYMSQSFPTITGKRICLLIAHPDDEAMFFAPTLLWLSRPEFGNIISILCLSSGNADGLGSIRKQEIRKSALILGVKEESHVLVIEDEKLPDSMTAMWDPKVISNLLAGLFTPKLASTPLTQKPTALINVLITFDQGGVSGHPNHISLYHGACQFMRTLMQGRAGWESPVKMYTLTSTNVVRKYSSVVDCATTVVSAIFMKKERGQFPTPLITVSGPMGLRKAQQAMTTAHKSQMRWFRWGWIGVSRYMIVNDLQKEKKF
jgi:N-acetylglucosaminylphosphatidylinositol deacetylase